MSNVMNKIKAKVDNALHGDGTTTTTHTTTHHPHTATGGAYNDTTGTQPMTGGAYNNTTSAQPMTGGAYNSNGMPATGGHHHQHHTTAGVPATGGHHHQHHTTAGVPATGNGLNNNNPAVYSAETGPASKTAGPHTSNIANKLDPKIDSDLDGSRNGGMAETGSGAVYNHTTGPATHTAGHHHSNLANKLDPSVNSSNSQHTAIPHSGANSGYNTGYNNNPAFNSGPGPAPNTQGPHRSDLMNELDPRVTANPNNTTTTTTTHQRHHNPNQINPQGNTGFNNNPNTIY